VYGSVANNINNAGLQLMAIKLDKDSFSLPETYADYNNIFNPNKTAKLQTQTHITYAINLENKAKTFYGPIYYFSKLKLRILRDYLAKNE
jgi:flagellar hook protein FlgE